MNKIWLVLKHEFVTVVLRRSFLITLFLIPIAGFAITLIIGWINSNAQAGNSNAITEMFIPTVKQTVEGYVDPGGYIKSLPENVAGHLVAYDSEQAAQQALAAGEITAYYLISPDYLENGEIVNVRPDYNPLGGQTQSGLIQDVLQYNLLNGDQTLAMRVANPLNTQVEDLEQKPARDPNSMLTFFVPYIVTLLYYIVILASSSLMLSSVTREKENRVLEVLMTSLTPTQMLSGKIVALGLAGLLQTVVWTLSGYALLSFSGRTMNIGAAFQLPPSIILWGIVYFILGYAVYASLMAALGALVPNLREASQATTVLIMPMIIPLVLINVLIESPDSLLSVIFSLFPLTSPVSMMARLAGPGVPAWQLAVSILLLAATAWFIVRAAAGMFRTQNLLTGQAFSLKLFFRTLAGKAG